MFFSLRVLLHLQFGNQGIQKVPILEILESNLDLIQAFQDFVPGVSYDVGFSCHKLNVVSSKFSFTEFLVIRLCPQPAFHLEDTAAGMLRFPPLLVRQLTELSHAVLRHGYGISFPLRVGDNVMIP